MANIYLMRHAKVQGQAALYGHTDIGVLKADNLRLANVVAKYFEQQRVVINDIITSPLQRCYVLADNISALIANTSVTVEPAFKEMSFGQYDGVAFDDIYPQTERWQQLEKFWLDPVQHPLPQAELLTGFAYRINTAWQRLIANVRQDDNDRLIVCHGGVIRMILSVLLNIDIRNPNWYNTLNIGNGSLSCVQVGYQQTRVNYIGMPLATGDTATIKQKVC